MDKTKKIIIVDDSIHFRTALASIIDGIGNVKIIGQAASGCEMLAMLDKQQVDIVFVDIKMPGLNGIEATQIAHQRYPELMIIGFSSMESQNYIKSLINAGACGYLSKNKDNYDLLEQILKGKITKNIFSNGLDLHSIIQNKEIENQNIKHN